MALACVTAGPSATTRAETAEPSSDSDAVQEQFSTAVSLVDQGRYEEALALFREVQRQRPHPVVLYNIAWCFSELDRNREAVAAFESYLEAGGEDDAERRSRAQTELERLRVVVGEPAATTTQERQTERVRWHAPLIAPWSEFAGDQTPQVQADSTAPPTPPERERPRHRSARDRGRRTLRPGLFWGFFALTMVTGVAMLSTGSATMSLREQWITEATPDALDQGLSLRSATDGLLLLMLCEAVATLVIGLRTDFDRSRRRTRLLEVRHEE